MRQNSGPYFLAAVALGGLALVLAMGGLIERQMAEAEARLAVADLRGADRSYEEAGHRLGGLGWLAWGRSDVRDEVVAQRAAIRYWRGDYQALLADYARNTEPRVTRNLPLRVAVANAAYRAGQSGDATVAAMLHGLDQAIALYADLIQDSNGRPDLAFNYEFLVRLRDALGQGEDWLPRSSENPLGQEGGHPPTTTPELDDVEIFVPMYHDEREQTDDPTRGTDPPIERRG